MSIPVIDDVHILKQSYSWTWHTNILPEYLK